MKSFFFLIFLLLISCSIQKKVTDPGKQFYKYSIQISSDDDAINVSGMFHVNPDSSFFNVYGPFGISLAKIKIKGDSIAVVDITNKLIYVAYIENLSVSVNNIIFDHFTEKEERLFYILSSLLENRMNGNYSRLSNNNHFKYIFKGKNKKKIEIRIKGDLNYLIKISYFPDLNKNYSFSLDKYKYYKTIPINLQ